MEERFYVRAPAESDLQQINARAFLWFNHFLPRVDAIDDDNAHTHFERGGGAQVICGGGTGHTCPWSKRLPLSTRDLIRDGKIFWRLS